MKAFCLQRCFQDAFLLRRFKAKPFISGFSGVDGGDGQRGFLQHIQQHAHRIQRSKDGHVVIRGEPADFHAVGGGVVGIDAPGIDDVGDMPLPERPGNLVAAVADLPEHVRADSVLLQESGRSLRGLYIEAEVIEAADQRKRLLLVLVGQSGEDGAVILQPHACGLLSYPMASPVDFISGER